MGKLELSPVTEQSEQATAYAADGRMNYGLIPQCIATTDSDLIFITLNIFNNLKQWKKKIIL